MRWNELANEDCSIARTLSVIGDRWTLLILRDCFLRVRRFDQFEQNLKITRHVLADRLKKLVAEGVLQKVPYQERPTRYEYRLTKKGVDLYPLMMAIITWGDTYMADEKGPPVRHRHKTCGQLCHMTPTCSECGEPLTAQSIEVVPNPAYHETSTRDEGADLAETAELTETDKAV